MTRQFRAAQLAGHDDVGEQQIRLDAAFEHGQRRFRIIGAEHGVTETLEQIDHADAHGGVVFHHQDGLAAAGRIAAARLRHRIGRLDAARQIDAHGGAFARLAVDGDMAAALLDEAVGHRQSQAGAFSLRLGGIKGFEGVPQHFRAHAGASVRHRQQHILAGLQLAARRRKGGVQFDVGQVDGERAAPAHGVARVQGQVQNDVFQLVAVDQGVPQIRRGVDVHVDRFAQRAPQQFSHLAHGAGGIGGHRLQGLAAGEGQQLGRQPRGPFHRRRAAGKALAHGCRQLPFEAHQIEIGADHLQDIIEIVRHAAGQLADRLQLLRLQQGQVGAVQILRSARHQRFQFRLVSEQAVAQQRLLGDVVALAKYPHHGARLVAPRLIDEVDISLAQRAVAVARDDALRLADIRLAAGIHLVAQGNHGLPVRLGEHGGHRRVAPGTLAEQRFIRAVGHVEDVFGAAGDGDETGRQFEHVEQLAPSRFDLVRHFGGLFAFAQALAVQLALALGAVADHQRYADQAPGIVAHARHAEFHLHRAGRRIVAAFDIARGRIGQHRLHRRRQRVAPERQRRRPQAQGAPLWHVPLARGAVVPVNHLQAGVKADDAVRRLRQKTRQIITGRRQPPILRVVDLARRPGAGQPHVGAVQGGAQARAAQGIAHAVFQQSAQLRIARRQRAPVRSDHGRARQLRPQSFEVAGRRHEHQLACLPAQAQRAREGQRLQHGGAEHNHGRLVGGRRRRQLRAKRRLVERGRGAVEQHRRHADKNNQRFHRGPTEGACRADCARSTV